MTGSTAVVRTASAGGADRSRAELTLGVVPPALHLTGAGESAQVVWARPAATSTTSGMRSGVLGLPHAKGWRLRCSARGPSVACLPRSFRPSKRCPVDRDSADVLPADGQATTVPIDRIKIRLISRLGDATGLTDAALRRPA